MLRKVGRPKAGEGNGDNVTISGKGNGPAYLAARLRRDHPDAVFDESVRGSVRQAAIAAGIVKAEGNRKRSEAAKEQHAKSKPYAGEKMVADHSDLRPSKGGKNVAREARAA